MTVRHVLLVLVVVGGTGLCLLPTVSRRLAIGVGVLMIGFSMLAAVVGLEEVSVSLAEAAYYCLVIAVLSAALAWVVSGLSSKPRHRRSSRQARQDSS